MSKKESNGANQVSLKKCKMEIAISSFCNSTLYLWVVNRINFKELLFPHHYVEILSEGYQVMGSISIICENEYINTFNKDFPQIHIW